MTPKQESFAQEYTMGEKMGNGTQAYRVAYNAENMSDNACAVEAWKLLQNPKISQRVNELSQERLDLCGITLERQTRELAIDGMLARDAGNFSAAIQANMGIAKLHGLLTEDRKNQRDPLTDALTAISEIEKERKSLH